MGVEINHTLIEAAAREMAHRLLFAGQFFINHHRQRVSKSFHDNGPSKPGEYLHLRTGYGRAGVMMDATSIEDVIRNGMRIRIGQSELSWYMVHQERNRQRLGFAKTAEDLKDQIRFIVLGK